MNSIVKTALGLILLAAALVSHAQQTDFVIDPDSDNDGFFSTADLGIDQRHGFNSVIDAQRNFGIANVPPPHYAQTFRSNVAGTIEQIRLPIVCINGELTISLYRSNVNAPPDTSTTTALASAILTPFGSFTTVRTQFSSITLGEVDAVTGAISGAHRTHIGEELTFVLQTSGVCGYFTMADGGATYSRGAAFTSLDKGKLWSDGYQDNNAIISQDLPFAVLVRPDANTVDNCPTDANPEQIDTDKNGFGDVCDSDGDGVVNFLDACPNIPLNSNVTDDGCLDTDDDGNKDTEDDDIDGDNFDNDNDKCPLIKDDDQNADNDNDGIGDQCDPDDDNDGDLDGDDNCPLIANETQKNTYATINGKPCIINESTCLADEQGDVCDDSDGAFDKKDRFPLKAASDFCFPVMGKNSIAVICL